MENPTPPRHPGLNDEPRIYSMNPCIDLSEADPHQPPPTTTDDSVDSGE